MLDSILYNVRAGLELLLWPLDQLPDWLALSLVAVLSGAGMLWVFGKTTPQRLVGLSRDRMTAAIYEMRLFLDSPRRVLSSVGRMLTWTGAYFATMLPAFIVLALPTGLLLLHLESRYGLDPLPLNEPVVVQIDLAEGADGAALEARVEPPGALRLTAPPVYVAEEGRVYLRLEVREPGEHALVLRLGEQEVRKTISAAGGAIATPTRAAGAALLWSVGAERPLDAGSGLAAISLPQPESARTWLAMPWWGFWLLVAMVAALALRKSFGVTF